MERNHAMAGIVTAALVLAAVLGAWAKDTAMTARVTRTGDGEVVLEGVAGWAVGEKESSPHAAMESVLRALGEDITYDYLVGVSGLAFRMQVSKEGICPSSPHPNCGFACAERSERASPWASKGYGAKAEDTAGVKAARAAVVASIDKGVPVRYGSEEDGVIFGYRKDGEEWICYHPLRDGGMKAVTETKWPWGITVYTEPNPRTPPRKDLVRESLEQAVAMSKADTSGNYFVGLKAWDVYTDRVAALDSADDRTRGGSMVGNAWVYECLAQYRGVAARYLRTVSAEFGGKAAKHMRKAADLYEKMATQVLTDKEHCVVTVAPYPWMLREGATWTTEARADQVRRLRQARALETQALAEIGMAVAAMTAK